MLLPQLLLAAAAAAAATSAATTTTEIVIKFCRLASNPNESLTQPPELARKNLFQQLSVSLWQSNAKIILRYLALQDTVKQEITMN